MKFGIYDTYASLNNIANAPVKIFSLLILLVLLQNSLFSQTSIFENSQLPNSEINEAENTEKNRMSYFISLGYGKLHVSKVIYADEELGNTWDLYNIEFGISMNSHNTQFFFDLAVSDARGEKYLGTRPLVGGGETDLSSSIQHWGLFLGFRQFIYYRFYGNIGIGILNQGKQYEYSANVINASTGGGSQTNWEWYWGLNVKVVDWLLIGIKSFYTIDNWDSSNLNMDALVYQISILF